MRKVTIIFCALLISFSLKSQTETINKLELKVERINKQLSVLRTTLKEDSSVNYKKKYSLGTDQKVIAIKENDNGIIKEVFWYYENGEHFYSETKWSNGLGMLVNHHKIFFHNKSLIRWIDNDEIIDSGNEELKSLPEDLYSYAISLLNEK